MLRLLTTKPVFRQGDFDDEESSTSPLTAVTSTSSISSESVAE